MTAGLQQSRWYRRTAQVIPALDWLPRYRGDQLPGDLVAGTIVAVMLVPQGMAYAMLAGLPPEVGLYASVIPLIIYGLMGTSRALGVGPTAIASLMTASGVGALAAEGTADYVALALVLTLLVGLIRLGMGLIRAGFLVNFMSRPVLAGFINAAALMIAASQFSHLFGLDAGRHGTFIGQVSGILRSLGTLNFATTAIGLGGVALLIYFQRFAQRHIQYLGVGQDVAGMLARTGPLLTAGLATVLVWVMSLDTGSDVAVVGEVPAGLPPLTMPDADLGQIQALLPAALVISLVGFMESISIAKSLASRDRERIDANQELVAIGAANIGASLTGGFTVTGSFSRSVLNYRAGATSGVASIVTALIVLVSVFVLTPLFSYLPRAVLSAIVIVAVFGLVESTTLRRIWAYRRVDAATLLLTFGAVLLLGIELGIVLGVASSIVIFLWRTSHPNIIELGLIKGTDVYRNVNRHDTEFDPRVLLLRVDESLYFANTQQLQDVVGARVRERPELEHLVLVGTAINDVDASALETLEELTLQLSASGITVHLAGFKLTVLERLRNTLLLQLVGSSRTYLTVNDAVDAINRELPDEEPYGSRTVQMASSMVED